MSENTAERPVTVAFDGLHRVGKGTQARALAHTLGENGLSSVVVRGDGTRDGLGLSAGDPFSIEWQRRNKYMKSEVGGSVEDWNASSLVLLQELAAILGGGQEQRLDAVIVDRSIVSRAAFLLHRGVGMVGQRMTLDELYPDNQHLPSNERLDLEGLVPDVIFDLRAESPAKLLERLDKDDPKYLFRSRNIKGGFEPSAIASRHIPEEVEARVETVDAMDSPEQIHEYVLAHLGATAIGEYLRL